MSHLNIRLSEEDYQILELAAKRKNLLPTTLFRLIVSPAFDEWKMQTIVELYTTGVIGFKTAAKMSNLSLIEFVKFLEKEGVEPQHTESMEDRSKTIADTLQREDLFKDPQYKRKSPPVE